MEISAKYGFNLPNSANDDIADINQISDNFRIIDEIMNKTDQTFEPTSTKAASGKAVSEAISGIQPIDENTEFIFDGGNADGAVSTDIVVDSALSKTSSNAIMNKAVTTAIDNLTNAITQAKKDVLLLAYPVGSFYLSLSNIDPSTLFGGTWERVKGRFLYGIDTEAVGSTGGEKTHKLTVDEMPEHKHTYTLAHEITGVSNGLAYGEVVSGTFDTGYISSAGGNQPHNNMPPYLGVYIWKRTA